jgi:YHS domain-containing protein
MKIVAFIVFVFLSLAVRASDIGAGIHVDKNGIAARGYDPVAYFIEKKAVKGNPKFVAQIDNGPKYYFASAENFTIFMSDPQRFMPQYGGYCAAATAQNAIGKPGQASAFRVVGDKLYLFSSENAARTWSPNATENIGKADALWKSRTK